MPTATQGSRRPPTTSSAAPLGLPEHPQRIALNNELHARPATRLEGPTWISHLVMLHAGPGVASSAGEEEAHLQKLCQLAAGEAFCPLVEGDHWVMEAGPLKLKWERHNEFSTYTFFRRRQPGEGAETTALEAFPAAWRQTIPGQLMVATHVEYGDAATCDQPRALAELEARGQSAVAVWVSDHEALLVADFRLREGATRYLLIDHGMRPLQAGRTVQRLIEIETYRMMALLAFPEAKEVSRFLRRAEDELSALMVRMTDAETPDDERRLLATLTRLAAEVERSVSAYAFRFGAAEAYYNIVRQRIEDLREQRVEGFPSLKGFMERRLGPAIQTCLSAARRQNDLSGRIARKSALLRTRVDIELERQNQELLTQMNRRARLQLRLQETVEGLSVVAITYYASQIVHYLAKGAKPIAPWLSPEVATALAIPLIAGVVALGLRRMRRELAAEEAGGGH